MVRRRSPAETLERRSEVSLGIRWTRPSTRASRHHFRFMATLPLQRLPRSKNGCLTCRRRKVRCTEQRPRCGGCERLNLQCTWRPSARDTTARNGNRRDGLVAILPTETVPIHPTPAVDPSPLIDNSITAGWDFNDLIWQDTLALDAPREWLESPHVGSSEPDLSTANERDQTRGQSAITASLDFADPSHGSTAHQLLSDIASPASSVEGGSYALVEHFLASDAPPLLASIEMGPRWTSTKMLFASLAGRSSMVRNAVTAFSVLQLEGQNTALQSEHQLLYNKASRQLSAFVAAAHSNPENLYIDFSTALATIFFLSYSDLLTNRSIEVKLVLKDASSLVRLFKSKALSNVEKRLISWIRLVDGRASSTGGDGTFLSETDGDIFSPDVHSRSTPGEDKAVGTTQDADAAIEEILFDILYTPGLIFYQRVQSIMARVSNIDPWHRSRGTVHDETEVMALAAIILKDLRSLDAKRPALMDHAVAGSLGERHLAKDIAAAITRSYRTYWANYEAGFIHLHRVAHSHLLATPDVARARSTIKKIARLFEKSGEIPPTNFIWPILMASCEEDMPEERAWMIQTIRSMQGVACNAKPIADVLEEVHRRQDSTKLRADVRQASMDLFNMSFAVV